MNSFSFESGIYKKDAMFKMRDYRIMIDYGNIDDKTGGWWMKNIDSASA